MTYLEFIDSFPWLPTSREKPLLRPSRSELRRWFQAKSIRVNGIFPKDSDTMVFPCKDLVFFPSNKRARCTYWHEPIYLPVVI